MTDYNDGEWHPWNGGECPVHPESIAQIVWHNAKSCGAGVSILTEAKDLHWPHAVRFRVTKPYQEPETYTGECFAYHYTSTPPALTSHQVETSILGQYTATHINGKLAKIVWEASE